MLPLVFCADRGLIPSMVSSRIKLLGAIVVISGVAACVPNEAPSPEATQQASAPVPKAPVNPAPGTPAFRSIGPRQDMLRPFRARDAAGARDLGPVQHVPSPAASPSAAASPKVSPAAVPEGAGKGGLIKTPFADAFDRPDLGPDWNVTSPVWRIEGGRLCGAGARNHPAWLTRRLPTNARIEFEALSRSPDGDLKVELWGDGKSFAKATSYTNASSYIAIFGGWKNQFHVLARVDEHAKDRPEVKIDPSGSDLRARPVQAQTVYHFKVERSDGKTVRWYVDDIEILTYADKEPLKGAGHEHLGFNDWDVPVCFDNLKVTPLEGG
jgi:hypothetical protein